MPKIGMCVCVCGDAGDNLRTASDLSVVRKSRLEVLRIVRIQLQLHFFSLHVNLTSPVQLHA